MKVKKQNEFVRAYQNFKTFELKMLMVLLSVVSEDDEDGKEYKIRATDIRKKLGMSDKTMINDFFDVCGREVDEKASESAMQIADKTERYTSLTSALVNFGDEDVVNIFDSLKYFKESDPKYPSKTVSGLRFKLTNTFKKSFCKPLSEGGFILYDYEDIAKVRSEYIIRLFELCLSYRSMDEGYVLWFSQLLNQLGFITTKRKNIESKRKKSAHYENVKSSEFALKIKTCLQTINENTSIYVMFAIKHDKAGKPNGLHLIRVIDNPIKAVEKAEQTLDKNDFSRAVELIKLLEDENPLKDELISRVTILDVNAKPKKKVKSSSKNNLLDALIKNVAVASDKDSIIKSIMEKLRSMGIAASWEDIEMALSCSSGNIDEVIEFFREKTKVHANA